MSENSLLILYKPTRSHT